MPDNDYNFAFPDLMPIDSRREEGVEPAPPPMRSEFELRGVQALFHPYSSVDGNPPPNSHVTDHGISIVGPISAGTLVHGVLGYDMRFDEWVLVGNVPGLVELDIALTSDGSDPDSSSSICGGDYPAIAEAGERADGGTSNFTQRSWEAGDRFAIYVRSVTDITAIYFALVDCKR